MTTPLGRAQSSNIIVHGVSGETTTTIQKGQLVKLDTSADITFDPETNDPIIPILLNDIADGTAGEGGIVLGAAAHKIPPGKGASIIVWGVAQIVPVANEPRETVMAAFSAGTMQDAAFASHKAPQAVLLEAGVAATPAWAFVDFVGKSANGAAGFFGIGY